MFKRKYPKDYYKYANIGYKLMTKREINRIISTYGKKPYKHETSIKRILYDETTESYKPLRQHPKRGNTTFQLAIFNDVLIVKYLPKHITKLTKSDLENFRHSVRQIVKQEFYFATDKRFQRLRLDTKYYSVCSKQEHNLIHRIIGCCKKLVYNRLISYKQAWRLTAKSYNLKLILL